MGEARGSEDVHAGVVAAPGDGSLQNLQMAAPSGRERVAPKNLACESLRTQIRFNTVEENAAAQAADAEACEIHLASLQETLEALRQRQTEVHEVLIRHQWAQHHAAGGARWEELRTGSKRQQSLDHTCGKSDHPDDLNWTDSPRCKARFIIEFRTQRSLFSSIQSPGTAVQS